MNENYLRAQINIYQHPVKDTPMLLVIDDYGTRGYMLTPSSHKRLARLVKDCRFEPWPNEMGIQANLYLE